ncbi:unnamed protein product, partial [marine sediment metagenome]
MSWCDGPKPVEAIDTARLTRRIATTADVRKTMQDRISCLDSARSEAELERLLLTLVVSSKHGLMAGTKTANKLFHDRPPGVTVLEWSLGEKPRGVKIRKEIMDKMGEHSK